MTRAYRSYDLACKRKDLRLGYDHDSEQPPAPAVELATCVTPSTTPTVPYISSRRLLPLPTLRYLRSTAASDACEIKK